MEKVFHVKTETELKDLAEIILNDLEGGEILALTGDLGSGKTTFTKALGELLGVEERIISPTFILLRSYETDHEAVTKLHHLDLYRIENEREIENLDLESLIQPSSLVVIEWAGRIKEALPENTIWINFRYNEAEGRTVTLEHENIKTREH